MNSTKKLTLKLFRSSCGMKNARDEVVKKIFFFFSLITRKPLNSDLSLAPILLFRICRVVQLLVFGRRHGEDGGDRHQDGGSVGVTQLVDHGGGQNQAQQLEGDRKSRSVTLPVGHVTPVLSFRVVLNMSSLC